MNRGAYVLIFGVWALLTILSPILVQWSAALTATAKSNDGSNNGGFPGKDTGASRMMAQAEEMHWIKALPRSQPPAAVSTPPVESPALAPVSQRQREKRGDSTMPADHDLGIERHHEHMMLQIINSRKFMMR